MTTSPSTAVLPPPDAPAHAAAAAVFVLRGAGPAPADRPTDEAALRARIDGGRSAWIYQTWTRLRQAGLSLPLSPSLPDAGFGVLHSDDFAHFDGRRWPARLWTIVCRADRPPSWRADFEIVQNPLQADNRRTFYVHHWPQPGLLPRDPTRGATLRNVAYFGMFKQLPPALQSPEWAQRLRPLGLDWLTPGGAAPGDPLDQRRINDYRTADVVVALRDPRRTIADHKPPTKLLNAWLAGVPAIVGPESAYRALRTDALDFIEASDADAVLAALRRLQADPELYAAMCRRAQARATEVTPAAIAERWRQLLTVTIPAQQARAGLGVAHRLRGLACHGQRLYLRMNRHRFRHYDLP